MLSINQFQGSIQRHIKSWRTYRLCH